MDEVAEGLKLVISSANEFRNFIDGLGTELLYKVKTVSAWSVIVETMRKAIYTIGGIAHQLISPHEEEEKKDEETEKKE